MRIYGSLSRLVAILFRKDSNDITLRPNQATTYTAARDFQLPPGDSSQVLLSAASTATLTNKTFDADGTGNSISNIENADIKAGAAIDAAKIADGSVSSTEFQYLSNVTSDIQTQFTGKLSLSGGTMSGAINMGNNQITSLASPSLATDAVNKAYVDAAINGVSWKFPAKAASTANLTLSGAQTVDGVSLIAGDRILVKNQTLSENNGLYVVAAGAWSRATDMDSLTPIDEINGAAVFVLQGTANADKGYVVTSTVATLGTDPLTWAQFSSGGAFTAGNGIDISSSVISVAHDGEGLTFSGANLALELDGSTLSKSASGLKVATSGITNNEVAAGAAIAATKIADGSVTNAEFQYLGNVTSDIQTQLNARVREFQQDWVTGDGATLAVTHSLTSLYPSVHIYDKANNEEIKVDQVVGTSTSVVTLTSSEAPNASGWRVVVRAL